jgi:hypothetical protein
MTYQIAADPQALQEFQTIMREMIGGSIDMDMLMARLDTVFTETEMTASFTGKDGRERVSRSAVTYSKSGKVWSVCIEGECEPFVFDAADPDRATFKWDKSDMALVRRR